MGRVILTSNNESLLTPGMSQALSRALKAPAAHAVLSASQASTMTVVCLPFPDILQIPLTQQDCCVFCLASDADSIQSLIEVALQTEVARRSGSTFRVHRWMVMDDGSERHVPALRAAADPVEIDWVVGPGTRLDDWAESVASKITGAPQRSPIAFPLPARADSKATFFAEPEPFLIEPRPPVRAPQPRRRRAKKIWYLTVAAAAIAAVTVGALYVFA